MKSSHSSIFFHQNISFIASVRDSQPNPPGPVITDFLDRLQLLAGVPFQYLIPNAKMLPNESIRFFQVDPNWIACLVEGASSIGRTTQTDKLHDQAYAPVLRSALKGAGAPIVSGFLMRSIVVSGWPNLEVKGQDKAGNQLPILRLDRLSGTVVLCLIGGLIDSVEIQEPSEGIHFGVKAVESGDDIGDDKKDTEADPAFVKVLRDINTGDQLSLPPAPVPFRPGNQRVILLNSANPSTLTMASSLQTALKPSGFTDPVTSAEFALEMVEGVQSVTFKYMPPANP